MSLPNTPSTISIFDGEKIVDSYDYPSPNSDISSDNDDNEEGVISGRIISSNDKNKEKEDLLRITTKINFPKIITAQTPFSFYSTTTDNRNITYNVGKFVWNFGDGVSITADNYGPLTYTYEYPGDYIVNLYYFDNTITSIPDAVDRINIKVVPADIYISKVGIVFIPM
jgi:hypothetical protein